MKARVSLPLAMRDMLLPADWASPVCRMAPPTTKRPAIIMTMGEEKPLNASLVVRTPVAVSTIRADRATTSPRTRPQTNMAIVTIRTIIVMVMNQTQISGLQIYNNPATITNAARAMASDLIKP